MKTFKELGIELPEQNYLKGDKIKVDKILNKEIKVLDYKIEDSKFQKYNNDKCLYLQINMADTDYVVFTGSLVLLETIKKIPKTDFSFITTIIKSDRRLEFS